MIDKYFRLKQKISSKYFRCLFKICIFLSIFSSLLLVGIVFLTYSGKLNNVVINIIQKYGQSYGLNVTIEKIDIPFNLEKIELNNILISSTENNKTIITIDKFQINNKILNSNNSTFPYKLSFQECILDKVTVYITNTQDNNKLDVAQVSLQLEKLIKQKINKPLFIDTSNMTFTITNSNIVVNGIENNLKYEIHDININGTYRQINNTINTQLNIQHIAILNGSDHEYIINSKVCLYMANNKIYIEPSVINTNIGMLKFDGEIIDIHKLNYKLNIETNIDLLNISKHFENSFINKQNGELKFIGYLSKLEEVYQLNGRLEVDKITISNYHLKKLNIENIDLLINEKINIGFSKIQLNYLTINKEVIKNISIDNIKLTKNLTNNNTEGNFRKLFAKVKSTIIKTSGYFSIKDFNFQLRGITNNINFTKLLPNYETLSICGNTNWKYQASGKVKNIDNFTVNLEVKNQGLIINDVPTDGLNISFKMDNQKNININLAAKVTNKWQYLNANLGLYKANRPIAIQSNINGLNIETTLKKYFPYWANLVKGVVSGELVLAGPTLTNKGLSTFERLKGNLKLTEVSLKLAGQPLNVETPLNIPLNGNNFKLDQNLFFSQKSSVLNF